jgi:hypothetical protein
MKQWIHPAGIDDTATSPKPADVKEQLISTDVDVENLA